MRNLADFKRMIQVAIDEKRQMKSANYNSKGELTTEKPFAPVHRIQSNAFTLWRYGKESWLEFGKASEWSFDGSLKATKTFRDGCKIVVEISENCIVE